MSDLSASVTQSSARDLSIPQTSPNTQRGVLHFLGAALLACPGVVLVSGAVDAFWSLTHAEEVQATGGASLGLMIHAAGLYAPMVLPLSLGLGMLLWLSPLDISPRGMLAGLKAMATAPLTQAKAWSGWMWSVSLGLLVSLGVMVKLAHLFVTTFHHPTLIAVTLSVVNLIWFGMALVGMIFGARMLRRLLPDALSSPLIPLGLAGLAVASVLLAIPVMFEETWDALDLRAPVMGLFVVLLAWALSGTLATSLRRAVVPGLVAALLTVGLLASTLSFFGADSEDAPVVYALRERGLFARIPLGFLQKQFDADKDGYASRLGGGDCDDTKASIYPGADEIISNGIDEDCDGIDLVPAAPVKTVVKPAKNDTKGAEPVDPLVALRKKYNVVWVMIDTVRGDAMGFAGYERPTTPNLDKLAKNATVFERAMSISSKTPTVMGPVLAGQYPSEMTRTFKHFVEFGEDNLFVAEILKKEGYLTAAAGCHWYFQRKYGYDQGFDRWKTVMVDGDEMERIPTSKQVTDNAIGFLEALSQGDLPADKVKGEVKKAGKGDDPYFLFVHYLDPHKHYIDHKGFEPFGKGPRARYDGEIRFTDHHLGRLLDTLEQKDPGLKETIVIVTSDHGEAFGEHDHRFHGRDLYEHQLHVPLLVHIPGAKARRVKERVSLIDLPTTVLDTLGVEAPAHYRGTSLLPQVALGTALEARPLYAEMPPGPYNGEFRSLTLGDWKLIHRLHGNYYRLFNLAKDPGELKDLMKSEPEKAKEMKKAYQLFRAQHVKAIKAVKRLP